MQEGEWLNIRITFRRGVSVEFRKSDLIILSKDHPDDLEARNEFHALGIVESKEGEQSLGVRFYLNLAAQSGVEAQERRVCSMNNSLEEESLWWVCSLTSASTIIREWVALQHVHCLPFRDTLLKAVPGEPISDCVLELPSSMERAIKQTYNSSQVEALYAGLDGTPFVLIQGPPGTGKTHVILGLLSILLHSLYKDSLSEDSNDEMMTEMTPEVLNRLWAKQAPWIIGETSKR